ncbi:hypothetical protein [Nostoc sp.]
MFDLWFPSWRSPRRERTVKSLLCAPPEWELSSPEAGWHKLG